MANQKHYETLRVGNEWCLRLRESQRPVAWAPETASGGAPAEFTAYAVEMEKLATVQSSRD